MGELKDRIVKNLVERRDRVLSGEVNCIPLPFPRFRSEWPGIEQGVYYLVSGATKSAKTQLTNYLFVYNTILWCYTNPGRVHPKIFYFPLEETQEAITLRFMAFLLCYITKGEVIISPTDLSSTDERYPLPENVLELMNSEKFNSIMNFYEETVTFYDDRNVTGIYKVMNNYAKTSGTSYFKTIKVKVQDEFGSTKEEDRKIFDYYVPNDPKEYVIFIVDHVSLLTPEKNTDLRESINSLSEKCIKLRNRYKHIPVLVQQQSTETTNLEAFKNNKIRPTMAGLSDSKYTGKDCTMMIGITNPHYFDLDSYLKYDITKFKDNLRFMEVVLNRNGRANGICPLIFQGEINSFKEAPEPNQTALLERIAAVLTTLREKKRQNPAVSLIMWARKLLTKKH